jgi:hypothetical protein
MRPCLSSQELDSSLANAACVLVTAHSGIDYKRLAERSTNGRVWKL